MMNTNTTRRGLLKAAPAAAFAIAIPASAAQICTDDPQWEQVKARFLAALARFEAAVDGEMQADSERIDFDKDAPERPLAYTNEGWRIETADTLIIGKAVSGEFVLRYDNLANAPAALQATPEYASFLEEADKWTARRDAYAEARGWAAANDEWNAALDAQKDAWRALLACPVDRIDLLAEKTAVAREALCGEDEMAELLAAIAHDLGRLLPSNGDLR